MVSARQVQKLSADALQHTHYTARALASGAVDDAVYNLGEVHGAAGATARTSSKARKVLFRVCYRLWRRSPS